MKRLNSVLFCLLLSIFIVVGTALGLPTINNGLGIGFAVKTVDGCKLKLTKKALNSHKAAAQIMKSSLYKSKKESLAEEGRGSDEVQEYEECINTYVDKTLLGDEVDKECNKAGNRYTAEFAVFDFVNCVAMKDDMKKPLRRKRW